MNQEFSLNDYIVMLFNDTTFIEDKRLSDPMSMEILGERIVAADGTLLFIENSESETSTGQLTFMNSDTSILRVNLSEESAKVGGFFCNAIDSTLSGKTTIKYYQYIKTSI